MASRGDIDIETGKALKVYVRTKFPVPAADAGRLLAAIDRAFRAFVYAEYKLRARLVVADAGVDSFWAVLNIAADIQAIAEIPGLIPAFANNLAHTADLLTRGRPDDVPKYMRDLLRAAGQVGMKVGAASIEFISITRAVLDPVGFEMFARPDTGTSARNRRERRASTIYAATIDQIDEVEMAAGTGDLVATVFWAGGRWYARPPHMDEVLLPLILEKTVAGAPKDGHDYRIKGGIKTNKFGHPVAIRVQTLTPI